MTQQLKGLRNRLDECYRRDQFRLRRAIERLESDLKSGKDIQSESAAVGARIVDSINRVKARSCRVPKITYPDLPVSDRRQEILEAILAHQVIIVCGETGSGKTTQLPKICLEAGRGIKGFIGHTQPRRIAARTVATRIAEELGQAIGQAVGYKVRFRDKTIADGFVKLMTDGILLAEIQHDRFLDDYDTLIIDEAHERSLNIDFLLGYLRWVLPKRPDLKVIITSATIDPERFSKHFGDAPIINVSGRTYPVEIRYRPVEVEEGDETDNCEQQAILDAVDELWRDQSGDILIFMSGEREIRETAESLRKHHPPTCEILPLFSRLSESEQEKVFRPSGRRRVVLATNVAETSLTVPGIRAVIDTGYARISRYSHRSKLQRLPIERISQASANQRSGRCGRIGPGIAIRLYSELDFLNRDEFTDPEILRTNLASVILQMHALRLGELQRFPFVEPPDIRLIKDGLKTLQELNALDERGQLTPIGKRLSRLPIDPRLGRMLLAAQEEGCLREVAIMVSALSVPDPRERPQDRTQQADQKHARFKDERSDFISLLKLWEDFESQKAHLTRAKIRGYCRDSFLSFVRMREWHETHSQIMEVIKGEFDFKLNMVPAEFPEIHRALLAGLLSNVCLRQEQNEYVGARGARLHIHPGSFLFKAKPKWIISAEQVETSKVYARTVAAVEPEWIEKVGAHLVKQQHYDPHWERKSARIAVHERTQLFGLTIQAGRKIPFERVNPVEARELFIRHALVQMDYDSRAPFMAHNIKLLEEADYLQQKGRRVDLMVDEAWLFKFFDERVPPEVVNGVTFEVWRKSVEALKPDFLKLTQDDITVKVDESVDDLNFPDHCLVGGLRLPLQYRFEPGHLDDGVSVLIPLQLLNTLEESPFRWLVPGMLRDKVIALLKSLPKTLRIHFVPVPDYADRILPMLDFGQGDLLTQLSVALKRTGGISVPAGSFREELVPDHLKTNYLVLGEDQRVMDRGRNLSALKQKHSKDAGQSFKQIASEAYLMTGCHEWSFGNIPVTFDGTHEGSRVFGYPALVDEGQSVGLRILEAREEAQLVHEGGLARLLALNLAKDLKYIRKNLRVDAPAELAYGRLPAHPLFYSDLGKERALRDDVVARLLAAVYLEDQPEIRDAATFTQRMETYRKELMLRSDEMGAVAQKIMQGYAEVHRSLDNLADGKIKDDLRFQLSRMIYLGFWIKTPWAQIREFPRYLTAIQHRLQKAVQDPARDARQRLELEPFQKAFWVMIEKYHGRRVPERHPFRWKLEEFRVSLFAQQLKTAYPISAKRMEEALKSLEPPV